MPRAYAVRVGTIASSGQTPVVLVAADGESLSGTVQSNFAGNGFYTRNGFTRAANWVGPNPLGGNFAGFDDVNFLPISVWLADFSGTGFYSRMDDLGINGMLPAAASINLANNITYEKWAVVTSEVAAGSISSADDPGVVGVSVGEEPGLAEYIQIRSDADTWLASADGPGRFHLFNFADALLNGDMGNTYFPPDMVIGYVSGDGSDRSRRQYTTCDQYWIGGAPDDSGGSRTKLDFRLYQQGITATVEQTARGSHYGSMMDSFRRAFATSPNVLPGAPVGVWIENGAPYAEATTGMITPAQMQWAIWSTLVHGARGIHYFNHTFKAGVESTNNFNNNTYGGPGIAGTGIYATAKECNLRALQIAQVLNAPFDGYFCYGDLTFGNPVSWGRVETAGFLTGVTSTNVRAPFTGVDASCRWQPTEGKHYILATTREPETATNIPITCRMVDQGQTSAVPVFGGTSIGVTRGGSIPSGYCEFTDTFATATDYKCWRID